MMVILPLKIDDFREFYNLPAFAHSARARNSQAGFD